MPDHFAVSQGQGRPLGLEGHLSCGQRCPWGAGGAGFPAGLGPEHRPKLHNPFVEKKDIRMAPPYGMRCLCEHRTQTF